MLLISCQRLESVKILSCAGKPTSAFEEARENPAADIFMATDSPTFRFSALTEMNGHSTKPCDDREAGIPGIMSTPTSSFRRNLDGASGGRLSAVVGFLEQRAVP